MIKYFNDIRILPEGFPTDFGEFNTQKYIEKELVSMGIGHDAVMVDEEIEFSDNLVIDYEQFCHANLFACRCLNLRGSSFTHF